MKCSYIPQIVGVGIIATSLAIVPSITPAQAQTSDTPDSSNTAVRQDLNQSRGDREPNWSWLGLLGLAGLAGLSRKPKETVDGTAPNVIRNPTTTEPVSYSKSEEDNSPESISNATRYREPEENIGVTTEKAVRYREPNEIKLPDTNGTSHR